MDKIVNLDHHRRAVPLDADQHEEIADDFLITEGLDLLAAYRSIRDDELRRKLRELIFRVAQLDAERRAPSKPRA